MAKYCSWLGFGILDYQNRPDDGNKEIEYLDLLIADFGISPKVTGRTAMEKIYLRYLELERNRTNVLALTKYNIDGYHELCLKVHAFLYKGILSNAGEFRQSSDPNDGNVYFGGIAHRTMKNKFVGTIPVNIALELKYVFSILFDTNFSCIERAIRFYAEFVAIHPFYDANGRIGRYIVDVYLQYHNYYVDWQLLYKSQSKFLRKLNYCHSVRLKSKQCTEKKKYWKSIRGQYISYLVNFWSKFIYQISE
jgi:fido (protein-threonine AMPylation protein)